MSGCKKLDIEKDTPRCIKREIKAFNKQQSCNDGVKVNEYTFQGKNVYVFDPGNCGADMIARVIDSECNSIGTLGGISGNTKINGEEFSNAVLERTTWEK